jgi:hypothetical protein
MILEKIRQSKRNFNVNSIKDIDCFRNFLKQNKWGYTGCPFVLEYPHVSIPDMIKEKLIKKYLKI